MVAAQSVGGRLSDRIESSGRRRARARGRRRRAPGTSSLASGWMLLAAGVLFGLGLGAAQPALFALGGDLVSPAERGTAMASLGIFLELGIGGGGTVTGILTSVVGLGPAFAIGAVIALVGAAIAYATRAAFAPRLQAV